MHTKPRKNFATTHKEQTWPTHPGMRCLPATTPLCTCEMNVSLLSLQQSYCISTLDLAIHFSTTPCMSHLCCFLPAGPRAKAANKNSGDLRVGEMLSLRCTYVELATVNAARIPPGEMSSPNLQRT